MGADESARMSLLQRYRWFVAAAGITLAFAVVSAIAPQSAGLTAFSDLLGVSVTLAAAAATLANALTRPRQERSFWALMALGFALWASNQAAGAYCEVILHRQVPDIFFFDIILFIHAVPMIAAVGWRPDLEKKDGNIHLSLLNFLMLMGWWIFLYAFIVFPHQYVLLNPALYNSYYDRLYQLQNFLLLGVLGLAAWTSSSGWRRLYLHFLTVGVIYGIASELLYEAGEKGVLLRQPLRRSHHRGGGMDGRGGLVGTGMGSRQPRVQLAHAMEKGPSASRHARATLASSARRLDDSPG